MKDDKLAKDVLVRKVISEISILAADTENVLNEILCVYFIKSKIKREIFKKFILRKASLTVEDKIACIRSLSYSVINEKQHDWFIKLIEFVRNINMVKNTFINVEIRLYGNANKIRVLICSGDYSKREYIIKPETIDILRIVTEETILRIKDFDNKFK